MDDRTYFRYRREIRRQKEIADLGEQNSLADLREAGARVDSFEARRILILNKLLEISRGEKVS